MWMVTSWCYVHGVDGSHVCLDVLVMSMMMVMMMMMMMMMMMAVQVTCTSPHTLH